MTRTRDLTNGTLPLTLMPRLYQTVYEILWLCIYQALQTTKQILQTDTDVRTEYKNWEGVGLSIK